MGTILPKCKRGIKRLKNSLSYFNPDLQASWHHKCPSQSLMGGILLQCGRRGAQRAHWETYRTSWAAAAPNVSFPPRIQAAIVLSSQREGRLLGLPISSSERPLAQWELSHSLGCPLLPTGIVTGLALALLQPTGSRWERAPTSTGAETLQAGFPKSVYQKLVLITKVKSEHNDSILRKGKWVFLTRTPSWP